MWVWKTWPLDHLFKIFRLTTHFWVSEHMHSAFLQYYGKILGQLIFKGVGSYIFSTCVTSGSWVKCRLQKRRHNQSRNFGLWPRNISWWVSGRISTEFLSAIKLTTMNFSQMFILSFLNNMWTHSRNLEIIFGF